MKNQNFETPRIIDTTIFPDYIVSAVQLINKTLEGKCVFAGSFSLKVNKLITRTINDLDVFTEVNYYYGNPASMDDCKRSSSGIFYTDNKQVHCVHGNVSGTIESSLTDELIEFNVPVDYMYKKEKLFFEVVTFKGTEIKVEYPKFAIQAKEQYINSNQLVNREKHLKDLEEIYKIIHNNQLYIDQLL